MIIEGLVSNLAWEYALSMNKIYHRPYGVINNDTYRNRPVEFTNRSKIQFSLIQLLLILQRDGYVTSITYMEFYSVKMMNAYKIIESIYSAGLIERSGKIGKCYVYIKSNTLVKVIDDYLKRYAFYVKRLELEKHDLKELNNYFKRSLQEFKENNCKNK